MMVRFCLLLLLPLCISCKPLIRSEVSAVNSGGCGYIQWKERQLFTQASRIQDTLFGMLHDLDASAQEYEKKTGKALSFFHRDSTDFQDFLVAHKEKTVNFRSLQDELHKVFGKLQTINLINYSHCPNNKHLEIDGMNYGMLKEKKPSSCANYHNQINAEKSKVAELEKALITSSHDALSDAEEVAQMVLQEVNKLKDQTFFLEDVFSNFCRGKGA